MAAITGIDGPLQGILLPDYNINPTAYNQNSHGPKRGGNQFRSFVLHTTPFLLHSDSMRMLNPNLPAFLIIAHSPKIALNIVFKVLKHSTNPHFEHDG